MKLISFLSSLENSWKISIAPIYQAVKIILGPTGKNGLALISESEICFLTSGSSILKNLEFEEKTPQIFLKLLEQACFKTLQISGDGSTTTALLTTTSLQLALKYIINGYNPIFLSNGIKKLGYFFLFKTNQSSIPIDNLDQLEGLFLTLIGKKVPFFLTENLKCFLPSLRKDSLLIVEENISQETEIETLEGIQLERGYASSYFVNNLTNFEVCYENPYVLISSSPLTSFSQIENVLYFIKDVQKPLVIIAEIIDKELLSQLILNYLQKKIQLVVIKYSSIQFLKTGILEDLATLSYCSSTNSICFQKEDLGQVEKVIIQKEKSLFLFSKLSKVLAKRKANELARDFLNSDSEDEKIIYQKRLARLSGNILKIKLGNSNHYQIKEERQKVEKLLIALQSSLEEGILPGGGSFYLTLRSEIAPWSLANLIGEEALAGPLLAQALFKLFKQLFENNGQSSWTAFEKISSSSSGIRYDLIQKKWIKSDESFLLDSAKSIRAIFWNSINLLSTVLLSQ
jgi:chaperonin GroEL